MASFLLHARPVAADAAGAAVALLYVLLAGFGVPAQRTLYMLTVVAAALWLGRITNVSHVLCAALGVVVLLDPWAVLWPGFWLSFGAVAIILFATVGRVGAPKQGIWNLVRLGAHTQYVVTLGLAPLTMLLAADIEAAHEAQLVESAPDQLRAEVLLAPHHGSGTSSTPDFLSAVRPSLAVFQVGHRNRYRHPKAEVYERYGALAIGRVRTDESGAVMLDFGAATGVREYRREHARYWYGR